MGALGEEVRATCEPRAEAGRGRGREQGETRAEGGRKGKEREKKVKPVEGPLHPSWEVAGRAKEKQAAVAAAVVVKPAGEKITFD